MNYNEQMDRCKKCKYGTATKIKCESEVALKFPLSYEMIACQYDEPKWASYVEVCPLEKGE